MPCILLLFLLSLVGVSCCLDEVDRLACHKTKDCLQPANGRVSRKKCSDASTYIVSCQNRNHLQSINVDLFRILPSFKQTWMGLLRE